VLLFGMSLVRAVESAHRPLAGGGGTSDAEGYVLTGYFAEALAAYEKQETALRLELGDLIENINVRKERARIEAVQFFDQPVERTVKVRAEEPAPASPLAAPIGRRRQVDPAHDFCGGARGVCRQVLSRRRRTPFTRGRTSIWERSRHWRRTRSCPGNCSRRP